MCIRDSLSAMLDSGRWYAPEGCEDEAELVEAAIEGLGLRSLSAFKPKERIIEWALNQEEIK